MPFLGVFFAQLGFALRQYWIDHRAATSAIHRQRARWLLVAFSIAYLGCIDYVAAYGVALYPFGYVPVFLFIVLSAWTIRRFRLVDFTPELAAREILATVADPLIVCDTEGRIRLLNPAAASVLDRSQEEILGRPMAELVPPPEQGRLAALLAGGESRDQSLDLRARDGGAVPVELAVSPLRDRGGAVVGSVLVARDARPHRRAQAALAASEARYRALFEANPIPGDQRRSRLAVPATGPIRHARDRMVATHLHRSRGALAAGGAVLRGAFGAARVSTLDRLPHESPGRPANWLHGTAAKWLLRCPGRGALS